MYSLLLLGACSWLLSTSLLPLGSVRADDLSSIEHIVIFMQENRPFDHYYGMLSGVRGFNDRAAQLLPSGYPVWYQPTSTANSSAYMLPFHADTQATSATCMPAPTMSYDCDIAMWNQGLLDAWNTARSPGFGMSYFNRSDLPFYYALADAFTIGDQYFQSTFTSTTPNRMFLFSGSNGLSVGEPPVLYNDEPVPGYNWTTLGEVLEAANVSWQVYQQPDNFDDNGFAWFNAYQQSRPGEPLWDKGMSRVPDLKGAFKTAMDEGALPTVSIFIAPARESEHATNHPAAGEALSSRLIEELAAHPDYYKKTAFIINYDEGGQFFDHHWVPTAPLNDDGVSSIDVSGEDNNGLPIGPGFRVPLLIVSPWTRGGNVVSEVYDHTSVLQFLERRLDIHMPTISAWRRGVAGDLLAAFDFEHPDYDFPPLPSTSGRVPESWEQCLKHPPPKVPEQQSMPTQEPGTRPSRTLPYEFVLLDAIDSSASTVTITLEAIQNGASFYAYNLAAPLTPPRKYGVASATEVRDVWSCKASSSGYDFVLHGPNGFIRRLTGECGAGEPQAVCVASSTYDTAGGSFLVTLSNLDPAGGACAFTVTDNAYNTGGPYQLTVPAGASKVQSISVTSSGNWYDVSVAFNAAASSAKSPAYSRRYMGRIERPGSTTDPAATGELLRKAQPLFPGFEAPKVHPTVSEALAQWNGVDRRDHRSSAQKDGERCVASDPKECQAFYESYDLELKLEREAKAGAEVTPRELE